MGFKDTSGRIEMFNGTTDGKQAYLDPVTGATNLKPKKVLAIDVHDIRGQEPPPTLKATGYEIVKFPTQLSVDQLLNNTTAEGKVLIRERYWPEVAGLVKSYSGATQVVPWHFSVRKQVREVDQERIQMDANVQAKTLGYHPDEIFFMRTGVSQPASTLHIDNNHETAMSHLQRELGDEEAQSTVDRYKRWAIINVWRPIEVPVQRWPLLLVNHSRVPGGMSFEEHTERIYRVNDPKYYKSHDNFLKPHPRYSFWYASNLTPDEVIVFKDYDSRKDRLRGTPHGGFQDDATPVDAPARKSIEVRLFAFYDHDEVV